MNFESIMSIFLLVALAVFLLLLYEAGKENDNKRKGRNDK